MPNRRVCAVAHAVASLVLRCALSLQVSQSQGTRMSHYYNTPLAGRIDKLPVIVPGSRVNQIGYPNEMTLKGESLIPCTTRDHAKMQTDPELLLAFKSISKAVKGLSKA
eukprot:3647152-Rhodomonas_salina.2